jgi:hypothetical protein
VRSHIVFNQLMWKSRSYYFPTVRSPSISPFIFLYFRHSIIIFIGRIIKKHLQEKAPLPFWQNPKIIAVEAIIVSGILIYYLSSLVQYGVFKIFFKADIKLLGEGIALSTGFAGQENISTYQQILFICLPYLVAVVLIEAINILVRLTKKLQARTFLLFAQLSLFSFFFFSLILFILSMVFSLHIVDSWQMLIQHINADTLHKTIIAFCITIIIFSYFGFVLGRLKNYFSSQEPDNS